MELNERGSRKELGGVEGEKHDQNILYEEGILFSVKGKRRKSFAIGMKLEIRAI